MTAPKVHCVPHLEVLNGHFRCSIVSLLPNTKVRAESVVQRVPTKPWKQANPLPKACQRKKQRGGGRALQIGWRIAIE